MTVDQTSLPSPASWPQPAAFHPAARQAGDNGGKAETDRREPEMALPPWPRVYPGL